MTEVRSKQDEYSKDFLIPDRRISKAFKLLSQLALLGNADSRLTAEEPDFYQSGGFHRVGLGDTFHHGQFTILRKLGYGQYSTVWLVRDSK